MGDVNEFVGMVQEIAIANQYHIELVKKDAVVVDAGANMGVFSTLVASKYPGATVYSFEPTPDTFATLQKNIQGYKNIKAFNKALGEVVGMAKLAIASSHGGNHIAEEGIPIEVATIDSLDMKVDFIKMDTEGYEANILKGARETIKKYKPVIAMSAYHNPNDKEDLPRLLKEISPDYICELHQDYEEDLICYVNKAE